jgi:ribosomal protein S18 acetylase RimI-like enzyme
MNLAPSGYTLRRPTTDDLPAIQALLDAAESADLGEACRHEMDFALFAATSKLDLERGVWVAVDRDDALAACGWLWEPREGDAEFIVDHYVHPDHRDGPVDDLLIDALEDAVARRYAEMPEMTRSIFFSEVINVRRRVSLQARGYEHVRDFYGMRIGLRPGLSSADWPDGIEARPIRPREDAHVAHEASEDAFSEHFLFGPTSFEDWSILTIGHEDCDPSLWLLAWDGDEVAGQVWAVARDEGGSAEVGMIEDLSVRKPWRGRGLAAALLSEIFRILGERGCRTTRLFVDAQNGTGALGVYERAGMRVERRIEAYARSLAQGPDPTAATSASPGR